VIVSVVRPAGALLSSSRYVVLSNALELAAARAPSLYFPPLQFYFQCQVSDHCSKGQKLVVNVAASIFPSASCVGGQLPSYQGLLVYMCIRHSYAT
jgi:hypothetical protein